ncbi:aminotransferase class I/II-fold pyridoxal phosphate-dependent enzyme [Apilactobacillus timberlakei]|uniref:aminotransferase class I/II-fold pyridoxal phosphate-dependent enzyme n=1 Tax=Apilactobacillus timberlakei TaxID=2008380 RepID=UPI00112E533A|nr:aminotransferase class I/II-fold pyridoxal phosphate-dependent enzyme [Apilactobacillus timberlakei]TPR18789.1 aminotransferase class I/II-fold pyridoxal phosphate-dependent enzyme [Apilactobacillus timberlakei]TPR21046.1 aminotransferase class I/II-fold pyridoxal phosphate-dependent enzyme [Apilactobacillus timberlakei]TPR23697.1 aminotransferase class I/II-fold pyridoxal phosphate-dependent enzyme [Apilactobacillus timberlakei]
MPELSLGLTQTYNQRLNSIQPSNIRGFDTQISKIKDIIKLTIGEPDLNTPDHIKDAAKNSIDADDSHYSNQAGKLQLRKAIHKYLFQNYELNYNAEDEIVVTIGATEAIYATFETLLNPGDMVILPTPLFSLYEPIITLLGGKAIDLDTSNNGFKLQPDQLKAVLDKYGDQVKAVLLNYPGNPTGIEYSPDEVKSLADVIQQYNIFAITDEIYCELTYDVKHKSLAGFLPEQTIYINGLSKSHAMTGWRVGYVCGPHAFIKKLLMVHAFMVTCPPDVTQIAAYEALKNGLKDPKKMRDIYKRRRDFISEKLTSFGFEMAMPSGAFYVFVKIPDRFGKDDTKFALSLAEKAKVGVIPGSCFGKGGQGYIRLSYAASDENIKEAMNRIEQFLNN